MIFSVYYILAENNFSIQSLLKLVCGYNTGYTFLLFFFFYKVNYKNSLKKQINE